MTVRKPQRSRKQWQGYNHKFNQGSLTLEQFCEAEDLTVATFRKWRYKLASHDPAKSRPEEHAQVSQPKSTAAGFGPITISQSTIPSGGCCLELPGNVRLHTQSIPSVEYLHQLVRVFGYGH
jgi:hypothetical protein